MEVHLPKADRLVTVPVGYRLSGEVDDHGDDFGDSGVDYLAVLFARRFAQPLAVEGHDSTTPAKTAVIAVPS